MSEWLRLLCFLGAAASPALAGDQFITVASTTSTVNSGLFAAILPEFSAGTGIEVRILAQGTGQALETGRRGDADVVFVHARAAEEQFVAEGYGVDRRDVMYNDFLLVGPENSPDSLKSAETAVDALAAISAAEVPFASRGDESGTHKAEMRLWEDAGVKPSGDWYMETGSGMGATLNVAAQVPAFALTDRGTWTWYQNKSNLRIILEGDPVLHNPYGVILVNPEMHAHVKTEDSIAFMDWLISADGQQAIADYAINGKQLFFPNAD